MASKKLLSTRILLEHGSRGLLNNVQRSNIHIANCLMAKEAGRFKTTRDRSRPLTYEQSVWPDFIGVRKGFNSINTSNLVHGLRSAETAHEDAFIRRFVYGTWSNALVSDVIIKRRANMIILNFMILRSNKPSMTYFLIGYTEELLSYVMKSIVKIELQTVASSEEMIYKYI